MKMNKKGASLSSLYPAVLTIVVLGILLGIGIYMFSEIQKGIAAETLTVNDESITFDDSGNYVATYNDCAARDFTIVAVTNDTDGTLSSGNYTFSTEGLLTATATSEYNGTTAAINYTYTGTSRAATTDACGTFTTSSTGLGGLASWIAVIIVVIAASVVLGIVISSFGRRSGV